MGALMRSKAQRWAGRVADLVEAGAADGDGVTGQGGEVAQEAADAAADVMAGSVHVAAEAAPAQRVRPGS